MHFNLVCEWYIQAWIPPTYGETLFEMDTNWPFQIYPQHLNRW